MIPSKGRADKCWGSTGNAATASSRSNLGHTQAKAIPEGKSSDERTSLQKGSTKGRAVN